jgi:four helix bundle protein
MRLRAILRLREHRHKAFSTWHLAFGRQGRSRSERLYGLEGWERAHQLTFEIYRATGEFPREELFGLTSQMRRCSASIGANIAEECGKRGNNEFQRFLQIASGSASELDYHLLLARDLHFLSDADYRRMASECPS